MKTFDDLMRHFLQDMFYAEQQTARHLPGIVAAFQSGPAREAAEVDLRVARSRVEGLKKVFAALGHELKGATCEAILGLLKETDEVLADSPAPGPIRDAGLLACMLAIQHYGTARYGALLAWTKLSGNPDASGLLSGMVKEAQESCERLHALAAGEVGLKARSAGG